MTKTTITTTQLMAPYLDNRSELVKEKH